MHDYEDLIAAAARSVEGNGRRWYDERRPGATEESIVACEQRIGAALPDSYRSFLLQCDGLELGIQRRPLVAYVITLLGTADIIESTLDRRAFAKDCFPEESFDGLIVFADTMDGDVCLFDRSQERGALVPVLGGNHEDDPDGWRTTVIAADFDQWYRNVLTYVAEYRDHDDFRYWWVEDWTVRP